MLVSRVDKISGNKPYLLSVTAMTEALMPSFFTSIFLAALVHVRNTVGGLTIALCIDQTWKSSSERRIDSLVIDGRDQVMEKLIRRWVEDQC